MAEEEPRVQKVLAYLESIKEYGLVRPKTIGEAIGIDAKIVGKGLHDLKERGLAVPEEEGLWKITPEGTESIIEADKRKQASMAEPKAEPSRTEPKTEQKPELKGVVPTQVDILRSIGESLGVGAKKGEVRLDAIIYYVHRTALCFLYSLVQGVQRRPT
jgi:predicted transcriptional regulator